jgi:hypothetical protein
MQGANCGFNADETNFWLYLAFWHTGKTVLWALFGYSHGNVEHSGTII